MTPPYRLHYAPDNASLCVRLALEELGTPYETVLVDRATNGQRDAGYLALNPNGLIPVLETQHGAIFETAAILLWLSDAHGSLAPSVDMPARGDFLKWLFFLSNTLHPALRMLFYPVNYIGPNREDQMLLQTIQRRVIDAHLRTLNDHLPRGAALSIIDLYLGPMLRWCALYPVGADASWFQLNRYPNLRNLAETLQNRASTRAAQQAEGLGPTPFTAPRAPVPPEGSAT